MKLTETSPLNRLLARKLGGARPRTSNNPGKIARIPISFSEYAYHTELVVRRRRAGEHRWSTDAGTGDLIRDLARYLSDELIAGLLNRLGKKTGKGNSWTKSRVCNFRSRHGVAVYRKGERQEREELILSEAAERLSVDSAVIRRLISSGVLPARQACKGAPWIIREDALDSPDVLARLAGRRPLTTNPNQKRFDFQ